MMADGSAPPLGSFSEQDLTAAGRRSQLSKQGSVLSNYISEPPWRPPNCESDIEIDEDYDESSVSIMSPAVGFNHGRRPNLNTDQEDVGYSGMDSEEDSNSMERRTSRKPRRRMARGQPVGANSSSEYTDQKIFSSQEVDAATPERVFKVVFVGDSSVGKSTFIHRFCNNEFKVAFQATIGVDFQVKNLRVDNHIIAMQLWDTAGQERFRSITKQYFRKADGVLVMYDVTSETTFRNIRNWMNSVQEGTEDSTVVLIAGNKMDLVDEGQTQAVSAKDGTRLADEFGSLFYEVSAKSGQNVAEAIEAMARLLREREDKEMEKALQLSEAVDRKRKCCN